MTACDDVDLILAVGAAAGGFQSDEIETVRSHLEGCRRCTEAAAAYTATADLLAVAVEQVPPPEGLRTRIMAEVYATAPAATRAARGAVERPASLRGRLAGLWRAIPAGRGFTMGGALAAAAAVALLVVAVTRGGGAAPVSAPVSGALGGPAVQGSFTYYPGTQTGVLDVHGLAPLPSSGVYEVWLVRSSTSVSAAGYLTEQPDGSWTVAIHGSLAGYSALAATSETERGLARPAGPVVLSGSLPST